MSISPKMSNSTPTIEQAPQWQERHERTRDAPLVLQRLTQQYRHQLKYVIESPSDITEVDEHLRQFPNLAADCVWLMPEGIEQEQLENKASWLSELAAERGFQFCPRMQIEWFGSRRGS